MSDEWLRDNITKMLRSTNPEVKKTGELLLRNQDLIRRKANLMKPDGSNRWNKIGMEPTKVFKE